MEKNFNEFQGYSPYGNIPNNFDMNNIYKDPMFNPIMQYEQACIKY